MIRVCQLFISPGHNFFGHHGQPAGEHPMVAVARIACVAGYDLRDADEVAPIPPASGG